MSVEKIQISCLGRIVTGKTPSTTNSSFFDGEFPFVTPSDLDWKTYYCRKTDRTVTSEANKAYKNQFIPSGSVMVTCIGNTIGKCGLSSGDCLTNQQVNSIIPLDGIDSRFVYYLLVHNTEVIRGVGLGGGAATPILNKTTFSNIKLRVPPVRQWAKIAHILSAYDDLIENNRRRIQLLEESARLLYKEWFVRLRFPGHEHVKVVDGVPEGWKKEKLKALTNKIGSGATPRGGTAAYKTEGITLVRSMNVYDYYFEHSGLAFIDDSQAEKLSNVIVEHKDVLLNITGASVGRCCMMPLNHLPARVNQHVMIIRANTECVSSHYILHFVNHDANKQLLMNIAQSGGATREALTKDIISNFMILLPAKSTLDAFDARAEVIYKQQQVLAQQNIKLAQARDLLLPRLMNGEVAV